MGKPSFLNFGIFSTRCIVYRFRSRYYPTLVSLRLQHPIVHFLAFAHVISIIIYTIYRESLCLDFLPHSENFSELDEVKLRIVGLDHFSETKSVKILFLLETWYLVYYLRIDCEFATLRFTFVHWCRTRHASDVRFTLWISTEKWLAFTFSQLIRSDEVCFFLIEIKHLPKSHQETHSSDADPADDISFFQKCLDKVYRWDEDFLFTAMTISTYAVNFIILFHLACTFSFLYTTRMMSPISFLTNSFEQMFNIG